MGGVRGSARDRDRDRGALLPTSHHAGADASFNSRPRPTALRGLGRRTGPGEGERREWDSNPRRLASHGFSRAAHLSALPSLRAVARVVGEHRRAGPDCRRPHDGHTTATRRPHDGMVSELRRDENRPSLRPAIRVERLITSDTAPGTVPLDPSSRQSSPGPEIPARFPDTDGATGPALAKPVRDGCALPPATAAAPSTHRHGARPRSPLGESRRRWRPPRGRTPGT